MRVPPGRCDFLHKIYFVAIQHAALSSFLSFATFVQFYFFLSCRGRHLIGELDTVAPRTP